MPYSDPEHQGESSLSESTAATFLKTPITVLVVDDHALVRTTISRALSSRPEVKRVIMAQNYSEAKEYSAHLQPTIIWLDMQIGHADSIEEIRRLRQLAPTSHVMALTDVENEQEAFAVIMAGAQGYRSKQDVDPGDIMTLISTLCRGEFVLRAVLLARLMQRLRTAAFPLWASENRSGPRVLLCNGKRNELAQLTPREHEVLQFLSQGLRDRTIAERLHITEQTVQKHVQSILNKLGVQNRTEAASLIHHRATLFD
jgi:DNA-binding NarL/FixJ family response regulator